MKTNKTLNPFNVFFIIELILISFINCAKIKTKISSLSSNTNKLQSKIKLNTESSTSNEYQEIISKCESVFPSISQDFPFHCPTFKPHYLFLREIPPEPYVYIFMNTEIKKANEECGHFLRPMEHSNAFYGYFSECEEGYQCSEVFNPEVNYEEYNSLFMDYVEEESEKNKPKEFKCLKKNGQKCENLGKDLKCSSSICAINRNKLKENICTEEEKGSKRDFSEVNCLEENYSECIESFQKCYYYIPLLGAKNSWIAVDDYANKWIE
ncbi:MAG: hypothetical protein MJ252_02760 [archaeon]|nr:hypothetical protein [archaeon]